MSERAKHLFLFKASQVAKAAKSEAEYHAVRAAYWRGELENATAVVERTASLKVVRQAITGGWTSAVVVDYGDTVAYQRMGEAAHKIQTHEHARERYDSDAALYETQDRDYELDADDVAHFRLNGRAREE